jgi:TonB family protein
MTMSSSIVDPGRKRARLPRLTDSLHPTSGRFWGASRSILCVVALGALSPVAVSAQEHPKPQSEAAPPPVPSPAASASSSAASWQQSLGARLARLQSHKALGVQGVVSLAFSIDRQGNLVSSRIVKSSGSAPLDAAALDLIKRAAPFPPPPAGIADSELSFVVPIRFAAR